LPLKLNGKVFGYLGIISDNEHAFEGDGLLLIQEVADDIAFKIRTLKDAELRLRAEKELFFSEKRLEMVLEGADLGWWDRNTLTDNVIRSQRWAQMLGYSLDEIGPHVADWEQLIHPEDRARVKQLLEDHLESRTSSYHSEHRLRTKYGEWIWILERGKIMERDKNGRPLRITGTHLDITDRKLMEEGLRRSEEKFSTAFQLSPEPITISRVIDGKYVSVNERFNKLSGYTEEEVIGKTALEFNLWEETEEGNRLTEKLKTEGKFEGLECCFRRKNGEIRHGLVSSAIIDINGEPHIITVIKDITDLKRSEQERENLRAQLIQSQKIEALGTLVGGIAHDFNNMLQSMLGYSELLLTGKKEGEPGYKELQTVIKVGEGGAELVQKLLAFGQQAQVITIPIDLNEQIRNLNKLISRTLPNIVQVDLDLAHGQTKIRADRGQIDQLVMNLAINASEAMPNGGRLKISTKNVSFDGEYCRNCKGVKRGSYVMLSVSDTGRGMDKETLTKIFDPFFSTKQRGSTRGTGLGLSVVQGIVHQHGGHVTCESEPGRGTEFKIYFPASEEPLADAKTFSPTIQTEGSETILLVEDCSPVAELETKFLENSGYNVVIATNGREALDIYRKRKEEISLVLLDLIMPEMSGRDCLMELVKIDPSVKVLIASGYAPEDELQSEISPIVKGFLHKPFAIAELLNQTRSVLDSD
jgi:PAS domain S-box-containing protein